MPGSIEDDAVSGWNWITETALEGGGTFTFARGVSQERVMQAFGMNPANAFLAGPSWEDRALPYPDWSRTYPPEHPWIRVGTTGEWGFALDESASGFGDYAEDAAYALSAGTEAILVTHTASIDGFHYYADEIEVAAFEPLRAWERWGTDPDRFVPQMRTVGLAVSPPPPGSYPPFRNPRIAALDMLTLALGVQLPREVALGRLLTVQRD